LASTTNYQVGTKKSGFVILKFETIEKVTKYKLELDKEDSSMEYFNNKLHDDSDSFNIISFEIKPDKYLPKLIEQIKKIIAVEALSIKPIIKTVNKIVTKRDFVYISSHSKIEQETKSKLNNIIKMDFNKSLKKNETKLIIHSCQKEEIDNFIGELNKIKILANKQSENKRTKKINLTIVVEKQMAGLLLKAQYIPDGKGNNLKISPFRNQKEIREYKKNIEAKKNEVKEIKKKFQRKKQ